jgi:hypothetical protein
MTLYKFNAPDEQERVAVAIQGTFVAVRFENNLCMALYSHPNFYAKVLM